MLVISTLFLTFLQGLPPETYQPTQDGFRQVKTISIQSVQSSFEKEVYLSLACNDSLSSTLALSHDERTKVSDYRSERASKPISAEDAAKDLRDVLSDNSQRQLSLLALKLAIENRQLSERKTIHPFKIIYLSVATSGLINSERLRDLELEVDKQIAELEKKRSSIASSMLAQVLDEIPETKAKLFRSLVGNEVHEGFLIHGSFSSIEDAKSRIVCDLLAKEKVAGALDLVESQVRQLDQIVHSFQQDPLLKEVSEEMVLVERLELANRGVIEQLASEHDIVSKRLIGKCVREVEKILLPHQLSELKAASVQVFLKQQGLAAFEWPQALAAELRLSDNELTRLAKATRLAKENFTVEMEKETKPGKNKLLKVVPEKARELVDEMSMLMKNNFHLNDLDLEKRTTTIDKDFGSLFRPTMLTRPLSQRRVPCTATPSPESGKPGFFTRRGRQNQLRQ